MAVQIDNSVPAPRLALSVVSHQPVPVDIRRITWAEQVGFDDVWTAEMPGVDPFILSALALRETTHLRVGIGIAAITARSATAMAIAAQSLADIAPGRFMLGLGTSSDQINQRWHGVSLGSPVAQLGSYTRQVTELLAGGTHSHDQVRVRLPKPTRGSVPVYLGVLGPRMVSLASEVADGVMAVFVGARWVSTLRFTLASLPRPREGRMNIAARVFVPLPGDDPGALHQVSQLIGRYAAVPAYGAHFARLGYPHIAPDALPFDLVDELVPHGALDTQVSWLNHLAAAGCDSIALEPVTAEGLANETSNAATIDMVNEHLAALVDGWKRLQAHPG